MAIFGNFKGTTQSEFQIGKNSEGSKISTGTQPSSGISQGDVYVDSSNSTIKIYNNAWVSVGSTLTDLNVDSGTLFVDSSNDTVSVGSTASNDKLFVNGSLRLGTNPTLKFSGAYLDVAHSNGTATQLRVRDNGSSSDPIFKVYNASNSAEVFKVQGSTTTINNAYSLPTADGSANQVLKTDGSGTLSFSNVASVEGSNTQIQFNDGGSMGADESLTFDKQTDTLQTGVVKGVLFESITDYGLITTSANMTIDYGAVNEAETTSAIGDFEFINDVFGPVGDSFVVSSLPNAAQPGQMIYVSNETGGSVMAFSDGSNWRRITDRAVVS
tara:strand:+ start:200 stop:1180 length:981 start_codon:yes stop_codon:yes gene_type:complete